MVKFHVKQDSAPNLILKLSKGHSHSIQPDEIE
jgi:hypothetical protein